jgi:hypothetical protein
VNVNINKKKTFPKPKSGNQRLEFQGTTRQKAEVELRFCPWIILFKY